MSKTNVWIFAVCAVVFGGMFVLAPAADWPMMAAAFAVVLALIGFLFIPGCRRWATAHRRTCRLVGAGLCILSLVILPVGVVLAPAVSVELAGTGAGILMLGGLLLFQLPGMAAKTEQGYAAQRMIRADKPPSGLFDPVSEVRQTFADVTGQRAALVRVVGPPFGVFCIILVAFVLVAGDGGGGDVFKRIPVEAVVPVLLVITLAVILEVCLVLLAAIQWTRFVATGSEPDWRHVPFRALGSWLRRWILFGVIFGVADLIDPWLKTHWSQAPAWQVEILARMVAVLILVGASPFALALPALALGEKDRSVEIRIRALRMAGRRYYAGAAMIVAPLAATFWLLDLASNRFPGMAAGALVSAGQVLLIFAAAIVGMTYVTRVYLRGASAA